MQTIRAKKSLGQHFLVDENIARKIVGSLKTDPAQTVLEIGPGKGVLTKYLLKIYKHLHGIELDNEAYEYLRQEFTEISENLYQGDILKFDLNTIHPRPISIIGNLPYHISSQIFFKIIENQQLITKVVCMIQKEVAGRITAGPGTKQYGILSVLLQSYFNIEYLFTVSEHVFHPKPKVKSAVIRLVKSVKIPEKLPEDLFFRVVKMAFNHRRKTLRNSLKSILVNLEHSEEIFSKRPEQLSLDNFFYLTKVIANPTNT